MKRLNNKILLVVLLFLLATFILTKIFRSPALERNLDADLLRVDTAAIATLRLYPAGKDQQEIKIVRDGKSWRVTQDARTAKVDIGALNGLLQTMAVIKPERIVSRKKEKWDDYSVGDTTGIHVIALDDQHELANWWIGKTSGGSTYLRADDEHEIYAVGTNVRAMVDKSFDDWRDKSFLRLSRALMTRVSFHYPGDSSFVVEKKDKVWMIGNEKADSLKVENYLNKIQSKDLSVFADHFTAATDPDVTVIIESNTAPLATVKAWKESDSGNWVLTSDLQQGVYFSDTGAFAKDLFVGRRALVVNR